MPATCIEGTALACDCPAEASGYRYCGADEEWGACECPVPPVDAGAPPLDGSVAFDGGVLPDGRVPGSTCTGDPEWCDGLDNDCDGVVDNGEPCPDSSVRYTEPYDGAVWVKGNDAIERMWPTVGAHVVVGNAFEQAFRERDGELFFATRAEGLFHYQPSGDPTPVPTPPCFLSVEGFGWDAMDRLYYGCPDSLRRGNGELLASVGRNVLGVLSSGKIVIENTDARAYVLLDVDGTELSRVDLSDWVGTSGTMEQAPLTTQGDSAFVVFRRRYRDRSRVEAVVFRVDGATAEWRRVRRVPVDIYRATFLALPDGTVLELYVGSHRIITEYPVEGPARVLFRTGADSPLTLDIWYELFAGPREPPR